MTSKELETYFQQLITQKDSSALYTISIFLTHKKASFRQKAVKAMTAFPFSQIKNYILPLLQDPSITVKKEVVTLLAQAEDPESASLLNNLATSNTDQRLQLHLDRTIKTLKRQEQEIITVAQCITWINDLIHTEELQIEGEVSSFQMSHYSGNKWIFFDLKDEEKESKLRCFSNIFVLRKSGISLDDGMRIIVTGKARVSLKSGMFSIHVSAIHLSGQGQLLQAFQALKDKLSAEGLFLESRKRPLPKFPQHIGLITSRDAAAYSDFLKVLNHRMKGLDISFHHAQVQGSQSITSILKALHTLNHIPEVEVIVLTRGGGSIDDLHAFNNEEVARAIYASSKPILCATGHERDETIAEYVADLRASTPSNAAELVTPHHQDLIHQLESTESRLKHAIHQRIHRSYQAIQKNTSPLIQSVTKMKYDVHRALFTFQQTLQTTRYQVLNKQEHLHTITHHLPQTISTREQQAMKKLTYQERYLLSHLPQHTLNRGFSLTKHNGHLITDGDSLRSGDHIETELTHHRVQSIVTQVTTKEGSNHEV